MKTLCLLTAIALALPATAAPLLTPATVVHGGIVNTTNFVTGSTGTASSTNNWPGAEDPAKITDGLIGGTSKYLNFAVTNTAVLFAGSTARAAERMQLWVANDAPERDPASYQLYGTTSPINTLSPGFTVPLSSFTLLSSGPLALPADRDTTADGSGFSQSVPIPNTTAWASYLLVFPTVKGPSANSMQISEVQLYDSRITGVEQFDYPDGAVAGKSGGTFWDYRNQNPNPGHVGVRSDWDGTATVASGRLITNNFSSAEREYNGPGEGLPITSDEGLGAISAFNNGSLSFQNKVVYYRVTLTTGAGITPDNSFSLISSDFGTERVIFGKKAGSSTFGIDEPGVSNTNSTTPVAADTSYTVVAKLDFGNGSTGTASLFLNPDFNASEPAPLVTRSFNSSFWSSRVKLTSGGGSPVTWDDLVVANAWDELGTVVTTTADEDNGNLIGSVSLREAVKYSPTGSLITFAPGLSGQTITLTHLDGFVEIPGVLTIDATALPGGITLNGDNTSRHFVVGPGKSLALRGLTLTGGYVSGDAGSIFVSSSGALLLDGCTFSGNTAGAGAGAVKLSSGTVTTTLIARNCSFSGNKAGLGGGIVVYVNSIMTLEHCTFTGNSANYGGAITIFDSTQTTLSHCTFTGNRATGTDSLSGGGAIDFYQGSLTMTGCILAGNTAATGTGPDLWKESSATLTSATKCLIGDGKDSTLTHGTNGNLVGTTAAPIDAKLSPLGYFGGPVQTMHPLIGSPAIDAAGTTNPGGTDARGFPRFVDGNDASAGPQLDIGAVEAGLLFKVLASGDGGGATLRSTLDLINASSAQGLRVTFDPALFPANTITLAQAKGELTPPSGKSLFIDASNLTGPVTISGNNTSRVFNIPATATVAMHSLRIVNGNVGLGASQGGGISNTGTLTLMSGTLSGHLAGYGGAIGNYGQLLAWRCTLANNSAGNEGGGIHNASGGRLTLTQSTLADNDATVGGAVKNNGRAALTQTTISGNTATRCGGIDSSGALALSQSIVAGNTANPVWGMDLRVTGGTVATTGTNFIGNLTESTLTASPTLLTGGPLLAPLGNYGGPTQTMPPLRGSPALDAAAATTAETDQRGFPRSRDGDGNGTALPDLGAAEAGLVFVTNTSDADPGSLLAALTEAAAHPGPDTVHFTAAVTSHIGLTSEILITDPAGVTIDGSDRPTGIVIDGGTGTNRHFRIDPGTTATFQRLRLYGGGGVGGGTPLNYGGSIHNNGTLTLRECTFADNTAANAGGAIYNQTGRLTIERSTLHGNSANNVGGAIQHESPQLLTITASTIANNLARFEAGAISAPTSRPLLLEHCTISGNAVIQAGSNGIGGVRGHPAGGVTVRHTIITGNTDANSPTAPNINPGFISEGNNLTSDDAQLAALGDYGGPTWTMPPRAGSPAIDGALSSTTAQTDQRGAPRLMDGNLDLNDSSDIGAVESPGPLTVTTTADQNNTPAGPQLSLREAIRDAPAGATIRFASGFNGEPADTITLSSVILFNRGLIVDASPNPGGVTIDGGPGSHSIFYIFSGGVCLRRCTLTGGGGGATPTNDGGAIYCQSGTLALSDCTFTGNSVGQRGGAVANSGGTLTLDRCLFTNNDGPFGGAVFSFTAGLTAPATSTTTVTNCTFTNNTALISGGAIYNNSGRLTLRHCTIAGNSITSGQGSGVASANVLTTMVTVQNSLIAGNTRSGNANTEDISQFGATPPRFISRGGNLIGTGDAATAAIFNQTRDSINQTSATLRLAPLADYGGPTHTMALRPGSPARDIATASTATTDQRGLPAVGAKDSGAYEAGNNLLTNYTLWAWETLPATATAAQMALTFDFDNDGAANELEWLAQTDPGNAASAFRPAVTRSGTNMVLTFPTLTGRTYRLQFSNTLAAGSWTLDSAAAVTGTGSPYSYSLSTTAMPRRFFRVVISQ